MPEAPDPREPQHLAPAAATPGSAPHPGTPTPGTLTPGDLRGGEFSGGVRWLPGSAPPAPEPGLALTWHTDLQDLVDAFGGPDAKTPEGDPDAPPPGHRQRLSRAELAAAAAEKMPPGAALAAILDDVPADDLGDAGLADAAAACRKITSWAQAKELDCVAAIASRSAAADPRAGTAPDGCPAQITRDAQAQVSLALNLTSTGAEDWTALAVTMRWRLPAVADALQSGQVDLVRARLIADATAVLDDETARKVAALVLPEAGQRTTGWLRAALRRAVIAADPDGAERRRKATERRAKLVLYPDAETTATLAGQNLPGAHAAAAMARVKAMARALKAAGAPGSIDLLSAQVYLGLLLGTQPQTPPAPGTPPGGSAGPNGGGGPVGPDGSDDADDLRDSPADPAEPADPDDPGADDVPWPDAPSPGHDDPDDDPRSETLNLGDDEDDDADWTSDGPTPAWPQLPAQLPPGLAGPGRGMLDLTLPWQVLAGTSGLPGSLSRLGPVTGPAARTLAELAAAGPATWRVIVTGSGGQAIATAPIPRPAFTATTAAPAAAAAAAAAATTGPGGPCLIGRVSVIVSEDLLTRPPPLVPSGAGPPTEIAAAALDAARHAAAAAAIIAAADADAGGCAHARASPHYRPPPALRDYVTSRDLTCRFPTCRNPAWRGDLDHTIAWDDGGITCACNLGGLCRAHHLIKQHPGWQLRQDKPGELTWTTPAGKTYTVRPDPYPI
jgi:Domain of unknown function (DUF222)